MTQDQGIVVAVDGSEESDRALRMACEMAKAFGQTLHVIAVVPPPPVYPTGTIPLVVEPPDVTEAFRKVLVRAQEEAAKSGIAKVEQHLLQGPVVDSIVQFLEDRKPMLGVLGARGLSAGARLFLGSVSDGVVHHAKCPILIARAPGL